MEWSIQQIAKLAGTTSRTLRHYDEQGLLTPSRVGANGYRYYDGKSLVRLQRILLFRELGLGLPQIRELLERETDETSALLTHLEVLRHEKDQLNRRIAAVEHTINSLKEGKQLMAEEMFDGFDHTKYRDEVEERWGKDAYAQSDRWWRGMSPDEQKNWMERVGQLNRDWISAHEAGLTPDSAEAQELADRHIAWLRSIPGTPRTEFAGYIAGLAEMYVSDERFAANYGGQDGARFVRDALNIRMNRDA